MTTELRDVAHGAPTVKRDLIGTLNGYGVPAILCTLMILYFFLLCRVKPLWSDEIITTALSTAGSGHEFLRLSGSLEANPPIYYLINMVIVGALGQSDYVIRLQSLMWGLLFVVFTWKKGVQLFGPYPTFFAIVVVVFSSKFMYYLAEARPYTLLCFAVALALFVGSQMKIERTISWCTLYVFSAFTFLALTHTFGVLYGLLILTGVAALSIYQKRPWARQALVSLAGAATVAVWVPMMLSTASVAKLWVPIPKIMAAYRELGLQIDYQSYLLLLLCLYLVAVCRAGRTIPTAEKNSSARQIEVLAPAIACPFIVPIIFVESHLFRSFFFPRYFFGLTAVYFVLLGTTNKFVFHSVGFDGFRKPVRIGIGAVFILMSAVLFADSGLYARGITAAQVMEMSSPIDWVKNPSTDPAALARLPMVFNFSFVFNQLKYYSKVPVQSNGSILAQPNELFVSRRISRYTGSTPIDTRMTYVEADDLGGIITEFARSSPRDANSSFLVFLATSDLDASTEISGYRIARVGTASLPFLGEFAKVYLASRIVHD